MTGPESARLPESDMDAAGSHGAQVGFSNFVTLFNGPSH